MEFQQLVRGIWAVPVNLPFSTYSRCLAASRRGRHAVAGVIKERRAKLERGESSPSSDVVTLMLVEGLPDEEIIDNVMFLMVAAHDTTAALLTFLVRQLEADKDAYDKVVQEQEEIARSKAPREALSWEDIIHGGDVGGRSLHRDALQVEARRRLRPQLLQVPAAVPVPGSPHRHRAYSEMNARLHPIQLDESVCRSKKRLEKAQ
ncbi:hypothetical protein PVAP13_5NG437000 [Panicum virgatum]|uniref:Uncharacterized protein n=1 Tax=Panicum virgatum TaxID=38727 RepID=A0A8T0S1W2_PANVG|nr:hypothetical protein PVAP13_5NG437000 [Panicum virgatum]